MMSRQSQAVRAEVESIVSGPLDDQDLRAEIELLADVIIAASGYDGHLTSQQVDAALHVTRDGPSPAESGPLHSPVGQAVPEEDRWGWARPVPAHSE